jgi:hypothetical protein
VVEDAMRAAEGRVADLDVRPSLLILAFEMTLTFLVSTLASSFARTPVESQRKTLLPNLRCFSTKRVQVRECPTTYVPLSPTFCSPRHNELTNSSSTQLSRTPTRSSTASDATTLVNSSYNYPFASSMKEGDDDGKYGQVDVGEGGDEAAQAAAEERGGLLGDVEKTGEGPYEKKLSRWKKLQRHWRDYLVRYLLLFVTDGRH